MQGKIVGIGEAHWYLDVFQYWQSVILSAELAEHVTDIVIEFGNSKHQLLLDNYLVNNSVELNELNDIWLDSIAFPAWAAPCFLNFFQHVKKVNGSRARPIRLHLVEPEFDWQHIKTKTDVMRVNASRDHALFTLVEQRFIQNNKTALVFFGARHLLRKPIQIKLVDNHQSFGQLMHRHYPSHFFNIWPHIADEHSVADQCLKNFEAGQCFMTNSETLAHLTFNDIVSKRSVLDLGGREKIHQLFDAYAYWGPQDRELKALPLSLSDEQWDKFISRSHKLNPRQKKLISQILAMRC